MNPTDLRQDTSSLVGSFLLGIFVFYRKKNNPIKHWAGWPPKGVLKLEMQFNSAHHDSISQCALLLGFSWDFSAEKGQGSKKHRVSFSPLSFFDVELK